MVQPKNKRLITEASLDALTSAGLTSKIVDTSTTSNAYTLQLSDLGYVLNIKGSSPVITMPANLFTGEATLQIRHIGTGNLTLVGAAGVRLDTPTGQGAVLAPGVIALLQRFPEVNPWTMPTPLAWFDPADQALGNGVQVASFVERQSSLSLVQATTGNRPLFQTAGINGQPSLLFDGVSDSLAAPVGLLDLARNKSVLTAFSVTAVAASQSSGRTIFSLSNGLAANAARFSCQTNGQSVNLPQFAGRRLDADGSATVVAAAGNAVQANVVEVTQWAVNWGTRVVKVRRGNVDVGTSATFQTAGSTSDTSSLAGALGSNPNATSEYFQGQLGLFALYAADGLDTTFQNQIWSYLFNRFQSGVAWTADAGPKPTGYLGHPNRWFLNGGAA